MKNVEIKEVEIVNPYGFIYITTNMINGKKYIGQRMFYKRWEYYLGSGKLLRRSFDKYGKNNFEREIIAIAYSKEELDELEILFIKNHNAVKSEDYYNISFGGELTNAGLHHTEETKLKISEAHKGKPNHKEGTHPSLETRNKMSESCNGENNHMYGKKHSKETLKKMSEVKKGENHIFYGKKHSAKSKKKMSNAKIKLNCEQVIEIREKYASGNYKQNDLSKEYFVGQSVISSVLNYKGVYKVA